MKIVSTKCSKEQQEKDMPELLRLNDEAVQAEIMWQFFGGSLTTQNGNIYQVTGE